MHTGSQKKVQENVDYQTMVADEDQVQCEF